MKSEEPVTLTAQETGGHGFGESILFSMDDPDHVGNRMVTLPEGDIISFDGKDVSRKKYP